MKTKNKFKNFLKSSGARMHETKSGGAGVHEDKKSKKLKQIQKKEDREY